MEIIMQLFNFIVHLDVHLVELMQKYGNFIYPIIFLIIFAETGLVVTPILPGDSLLFMLGALGAGGELNLWLMAGGIFAAAVLGDTVNYSIGKFLGPKVFTMEHKRFFKKEHLDKAHAFYEKYGGKTIILARFIPIIRTFAPFVAGIGVMSYSKFIFYNIIGAALWVSIAVGAGYFFGNIPVVKENFTIVILAIIFISLIPVGIEMLNSRKKNGRVTGLLGI